MPVTVLPTVKKDQLLFMTLKFKQYRRCKIIEGLNWTERSLSSKGCVYESNVRN